MQKKKCCADFHTFAAQTVVKDQEHDTIRSAVDYYFLQVFVYFIVIL